LHLSGTVQPIQTLQSFRADLLGSIVPTRSQRFGPAHLIAIGSNYEQGNLPENGSYLGIPLLLVTLGIVLAVRRRAGLVRFAAVLPLLAALLPFGPRLLVNNHLPAIRLPFDLFTHVPLLHNEVPVRYTLFVQFFVAIILAVGLDRLIGPRRVESE